jgi:DNA-nicking Smr family endonuclease
MSRRRAGRLTESDRSLWAQVAQTARPLNPASHRTTAEAPASTTHDGPRAAEPPLRAELKMAQRPLKPLGRPEPALRWQMGENERPARPKPGTPGIDARTARRMARGQRVPEARLDLHGMTIDRAHAALSRFIADSAHAGLRCVLVVTGKGRSEDGRQRGDGVLRRETPRWLGVAPLSGLIVGVFEAHQRHGGAGALYVCLKKRR